jgi:hypothetical protein
MMMSTSQGNFYGQDFELAQSEADKLNEKAPDGTFYEVFTDMESGGYRIWMQKENDEQSGFYDDGDQWNMPPKNKWSDL